MSCRVAMLLAGTLLATTTVAADEPSTGASLVEEKRCVACHDTDKVLLGPPYRAIALRHAGNRDVMVEVLAQKIIEGGGGNWGVVPMVPNRHVSESEARIIASWILGLE